MKNYDPNMRWGTHTIKVSFQRWDYKFTDKGLEVIMTINKKVVLP
jgi:hypothetical protein